MSVPIISDGLLELTIKQQCWRMGLGHTGWAFTASTALSTLIPEGWVHIGWVEGAPRTGDRLVRYRVWMHLDTAAVDCRLESAGAPLRLPKDAGDGCAHG